MYEVMLDGKHVIGTMGADNKITYDQDKIRMAVSEMIAGQQGGSKAGAISTTVKVVYRWDRNRKANNDVVFNTWKANPLMKSRITKINSLVFGRGLNYSYEQGTKDIVDRFWRINGLKQELNPIGTDSQLYGEVFIGLFPQSSGDVLMGIYESNQIEIDFDAGNIRNVNRYIVSYKDEDTNKDVQFDMMPIRKYLNNIEFTTGVTAGVVRKVRRALGLNGTQGIKGKGVMVHVRFNNASSEIHGTSDFKQVFEILSSYMNFVGDRLTVHQLYGSPAYDISIDTDDPAVIQKRIEELAGFMIGSNPVHNKEEEWKPLEFKHQGTETDTDEKTMRGLLSAGMDMPEHLLFNQSDGSEDSTFALNKVAEDRQDAFGEAFTDIHKFAVAIAGGDPATVDDGQIIFPEISTMSEKAKAETYVLKVGARICSRRTAAMNTGHNWDIERGQILDEEKEFGALMDNSDMAGAIGGRFTNKNNSQGPDSDDGSDDRRARGNARNVTSQVFGDHKNNN